MQPAGESPAPDAESWSNPTLTPSYGMQG